MNKKLTVALAGNPNSGKTTIFNNLTGSRQHVGNYPGVTVEKKVGKRQYKGYDIEIVDLPGTYSLTAYSIEEIVTRNFIIDESPDAVINVIDASNIERNLYLTVQFMELNVPLVLALNMSDVAKNRGIEFDLDLLSHLLGTIIVPTIGDKDRGTAELLDAVIRIVENPVLLPRISVNYGKEIEKSLARIEKVVREHGELPDKYDPRWVSIKLLEHDKEVRKLVSSHSVHNQVKYSTERIKKLSRDMPEVLIADRRYGLISGACTEAVKSTVEIRHTVSDKIDLVLTHRTLGLPIFLGLMYLTFHLVFSVGSYPMGWIESFFGWLGSIISSFWQPGSESQLRSLLVDGVIGGVGGVLVFLPNILLLFFAIAILEDSGYMARAAFIVDELMHKIGLHGKSFIPMLIGFGCTVPAIMATRTLENKRDRLTTMLVLPLMSCGARLPIYAMIIPAFFPSVWQGPVLWAMYVIGIIFAILGAKLLRATILKGESTPFIMELPPYRIPTIKGTLLHMWERGWMYVQKAGTIILAISIVMWALVSYPKLHQNEIPSDPVEAEAAQLMNSVAGRIGHVIEPVLKPMGFDWRIGTALIGAFAAKEVFVAQFGVILAVESEGQDAETLRERLKEIYTPLTGFCVMLFLLLGMPCMATFAVTLRESGALKWALLQFGGLTLLAYIVTTIVYQAGSLM